MVSSIGRGNALGKGQVGTKKHIGLLDRYITSDIPQYEYDSLNEHCCQQLFLLSHLEMQLTMNIMIAGVVSLLLAMHCKLISGRPLSMRRRGLVCHNSDQCKHYAYDQIRRQVADLNRTASVLFDHYRKYQGPPFNDDQNLNQTCPLNATFPSLHQTCDKKKLVVALYKVFFFFNTSLDNVAAVFNPADKKLNNTSKAVRGLLSNLTCLLCSEYNVSHVDVTYSNSSDWKDTFQRKMEGCQLLRWYSEVVSEAASILNRCPKQA